MTGSGSTAAPATASQAAMFYAEQKGLYQCAYNVTTVIVVNGDFTRDALVTACHRLVEATPAMRLRMGLFGAEGEVRYWFSSDRLEVDVFDLPGGDGDAARHLIDTIAKEQFESEGGPLARFAIVHSGPDQAYVAMICHHLVVDGPSLSGLVTRLGQAVEGEIATEDASSYADLVRRVRGLEQSAIDNDVEYWRARLQDGVGVARWPYDTPALSTTGGRLLSRLPPQTEQRLDAAAQADGVRVFHILAATVHWSLPDDSARRTTISTAASIRPVGEPAGRLTGYFINEIPLLATQRADETPRQLAFRESPAWRHDLRRRYVSFAELARHTARREGHQSALDRVVLSYQKQPPRIAWRGRKASYTADLCPRSLQEKSDLVVRIFQNSGDMECDIQWSPALPLHAGERFAEQLYDAIAGV